MPIAASPKIAIVGAGPAGLTCARILNQAGISVKVFEREASPHSRSQGGTLDLHEHGGLAALDRAGLLADFEANCRYEGEDTVISDRYGNKLLNIIDEPHGRPEIDRVKLRQILLDSLPEGIVEWNCHLINAEQGKLHFDHGTEDGFDLIIGADGAWSKVRSILTPVPPFYSGISGFEIRIRNVDTRYPEISEAVGKGSFYAWGDENGRSCIAQRQGDGSVRIYVFMLKPECWVEQVKPVCEDPALARQTILQELDGWHPMFREWASSCDEDIIARALYMLPVGLRWPHRSGVTVIGDAAHLMTPFAGEGVNVAMTDAMELASNIVDNQFNLDKSVRDYESWMFLASREKTQQTWDNMLARFDYNGAQSCADMISHYMEAMSAEASQPATKVLTPWTASN